MLWRPSRTLFLSGGAAPAEVKAFEKLQIVRGRNSSYFRLKIEVMHGASKMLRGFELTLDERLVNHNLGCDIRQFTPLPRVLKELDSRNCHR
jgi:hypothetical protein